MIRSLVVLATMLVVAGCTEEAATPPPLRPVLFMVAKTVTSGTFGPFASTVEARYQTQLGFQLAGRMVAREVYVGDVVHEGQTLATLDSTVTAFALLRSKADVANAQAQLVNAQGIEERQTTLAQGGNASQATLDNAVAGRDTAKARLDQAEANLRMAEDQMGYTVLKANFDAVVTAWSAEVGQFVDNGQAVVTLARPDGREAVVDIPDDLMTSVTMGMPFTAHLQAVPSVIAQAVVREIGPLADETTRAHRIRLTLQNSPLAFRLGTTITVVHDIAVTPYIPIPATAVTEDEGKSVLWILAPDGKSVTRRTITIAKRDAGEIDVASGLSAGDKVVTVGVHTLVEGQAVAGGLPADGSNATAGGSRP